MSLTETNSVTLIWVPGHANEQGNENADELAREGSEMDFEGPEPALPLTLSRVKTKDFLKIGHKLSQNRP